MSASMTVSDDLALYAHWEPLPDARFPVGVTVAGKGTVRYSFTMPAEGRMETLQRLQIPDLSR